MLLVLLLLYGLCWLVLMRWGADWIGLLLAGRGPSFLTGMLQYHHSLNPLQYDVSFYVQLAQGGLFRLGLLLLAVTCFLWLGWTSIRNRWKSFSAEVAGPHRLAVFRIATFGALLLYPDFAAIIRMSDLPAGLLVAPAGWEGILTWFTPDSKTSKWLLGVFLPATVAAMLGWKTKWTAALSVLSGLWLLGIPQFYGKINHYHHLLWFAMLAMVAPVSEVWALDARQGRRKSNAAQHQAYFGWVLAVMGAIYFFPGWWKVLGGGEAWLWGDAVAWQLKTQAWRLGADLPHFTLMPWFSKLIGLLTVVLELSWWWWVFSKKTRLWALFAGIAFHLSIYLLMDINFWILPFFYLVLLPFERWWPADGTMSSVLVAKHIHVLPRWWLLLICAAGFLHFDGWPLAVYPSFANPPEKRVWQVSMDYYEKQQMKSVSLVGDAQLRRWLPKTRLMGLHGQLTGNEAVAVEKIKQLDSFYRQALGLEASVKRRYVKRKIDLETRQVLEIRELYRMPGP